MLVEDIKKAQAKINSVIGKTVTVTVDRPLGSYHPKHKDIYYPINYGYIEGIMAPDGEEQDAYILGVDEAVEKFTGKMIAVVHRNDDVEEKWVVAPEGMTFTKEEIREQIHFQEQYFDSEIVMYVSDAEIWDLYNENRELLGKDHVRGEQLPVDGYHLVVHVWIRNSKGEYLISQRSANRPTDPLMWECVGGSVVKGEDSLQGAIREAKEEVGIDLMPEKGKVLFSKVRKMIEGKIFNDIMDVWLFEYDGEVDLSNATTDEVAQAAWMKREQIKKLFEQKMFVGTLEYFFTEVEK